MGALRLMLALCVVVGHSEGPILGYWGVEAFYAVNLFFIISGFYMSLVLNEKYTGPASNTTFYLNRIIRLYPTYWIAMALALLVAIVGGSLGNLYGWFLSLGPATRAFYLATNIFIVGQDLPYTYCFTPRGSAECIWGGQFGLNPVCWSISVELMFYAVAPYVLRSRGRTLSFLALGTAYACAIQLLRFPLALSLVSPHADLTTLAYFHAPSSILFFALGGVAYHFVYKAILRGKVVFSPWTYLLVLLAIIPISFTHTILPWSHALIYTGLIPVLFILTKSSKIDRFIGDLSYPAYMFHFPILALMKPLHLAAKGPLFNRATAVTAVTIAWSCLVLLFIERPLDARREQLASALGKLRRLNRSPLPNS